MSPMPVELQDPLPERVEEAAHALEARAPGFLASVRAQAKRLGLIDPDGTDIGAAVVAVQELAVIDLDVPTVSRLPLARHVKQAVKSLTGWYLGYFGRQVTALGLAVAHLGTLVAGDTARLGARVQGIESTVEDLAGRIERLEGGGTRPR